MERVRYIPQNYLEEICNEIEFVEGRGFDAELKSVIFSHIPVADRIGCESLDELLTYKSKQSQGKLKLLREQLSAINATIADHERHLYPEVQRALENQLAIKQQELDDHDSNKPETVPPPASDPETVQRQSGISKDLEKARLNLSLIRDQIAEAEIDKREVTISIAKLKHVEGQINNFQLAYNELTGLIEQDLEILQLSRNDIVRFSADTTALTLKRQELSSELSEIEHRLNSNSPNGLPQRSRQAQAEVIELQTKLDGPTRDYQRFITSMDSWKSARDKLVGDDRTPQTLRFIEKSIDNLRKLPEDLTALTKKREEKAQEILYELASLANVYREVHKSVQDFSLKHPVISSGFGLKFSVSICATSELANRFFDIVQNGAVGSFCGIEEGRSRFKALLEKHDLSTLTGAISFANELAAHLRNDHRDDRLMTVQIEKQLRKGYTLEDIYDFIFSFTYLEPQYSLSLADKSLPQLSPGERGMLLLVARPARLAG